MSSKLNESLEENSVVINSWLSIPSPWIVEIMENTGYGSLVLDLQHGLIDYKDALHMLQAGSENILKLARVPWNEPGIIMRLLDAGVDGLICPMVNNRQEAEKFIRASRYPPMGNRSFSPIRANLVGRENYTEFANQEIVLMVQIETVEGLENLEEILSVPGLDGVYVGTIDLSISMGLKDHGNLDNDALENAVKEIISVVKQHNKIAGIHTMDPDDIKKVINWGYQIITPINDNRILQSCSKEVLNRTKEQIRSTSD